MEDRLKNLKKKRHERIKDLTFTDELRQNIFDAIEREKEQDEDILLAILQLLISEKTGFDLLNGLRSRGVKRFEKNEGFLYAFLHSLEQKNYIIGEWDDAGQKKYCLSSKGKKLLKKVEREPKNVVPIFHEVVKGAI